MPPEHEGDKGSRFVFCHRGVRVTVEQQAVGARGGDVDLTGDLVWPTATIFCRYLCEHAQMLRGRRVLDLGAGTGLVGLVAAALGACVTLVDVPRVIPLLARNAAAYSTAGAPTAARDPSVPAAVEVRSLWWGDGPAMAQLMAERGPFDVVLCCEVVYQQPLNVLEALRATIDTLLLRPSGQVIFAYQHRDGAEITDTILFEKLPASGLQLVEEESLDQWDDSWDDTQCRWVRTYAAEAGSGLLRASAAL
mmetsp:Transcript_18770/g.57933  ORF Transcript_18770/g.57933 Transcript_18770/m.57933 type:complete len:250 (+) Transcript_18770:968-1717(+)